MNRTKFFSTVIVNGISELDLLHNTLSSFEMRYRPQLYRVDVHDLGRPDLISYRTYGTPGYWWIVCLVNKISDPLTDIEEGDLLKLPNKLDIRHFFRKYKVR